MLSLYGEPIYKNINIKKCKIDMFIAFEPSSIILYSNSHEHKRALITMNIAYEALRGKMRSDQSLRRHCDSHDIISYSSQRQVRFIKRQTTLMGIHANKIVLID